MAGESRGRRFEVVGDKKLGEACGGVDGRGGESDFREERFGSPPENFLAFHFLVG